MGEHHAQGTFEVTLSAQDALVEGTGQFSLAKQWSGDLSGLGHGAMWSVGDPGAGAAGYVAVELVEGTLHERAGGLAFLQLGVMADGESTLSYLVAPGSGHGELVGIRGVLILEIKDGVHRYDLRYTLPD